jgi:hypothetical protein
VHAKRTACSTHAALKQCFDLWYFQYGVTAACGELVRSHAMVMRNCVLQPVRYTKAADCFTQLRLDAVLTCVHVRRDLAFAASTL